MLYWLAAPSLIYITFESENTFSLIYSTASLMNAWTAMLFEVHAFQIFIILFLLVFQFSSFSFLRMLQIALSR